MAKFKTDIEIARAAKKRPIQEIGKKLGIPEKDLVPYGHDKAKVSQAFIAKQKKKKDGKLILVTATTTSVSPPCPPSTAKASPSAS